MRLQSLVPVKASALNHSRLPWSGGLLRNPLSGKGALVLSYMEATPSLALKLSRSMLKFSSITIFKNSPKAN